MAWKSAPYTGTHQERKLAAKAVRGNERRIILAESMGETKIGPEHFGESYERGQEFDGGEGSIKILSEPKLRRIPLKKAYGLRVFRRGLRDRTWDFVTWYATERARNDALVAANKDATSAIMPVIAIGKCER